MAKNEIQPSTPTMIIPNGAEITVDPSGQLSIKSPGNLVIQNSGSYGTIESEAGSIRIDENVQVEAVEVGCAQTCYVQGSLTAWKVRADSIQLEDSARAHIVLQEANHLEIGRDARIVGNFSSDRELFLLLSRFAKQLRSIPYFFDRRGGDDKAPESVESEASMGELIGVEDDDVPESSAPVLPMSFGRQGDELPEGLLFALVLLEREAASDGQAPAAVEALNSLVDDLRRNDLDNLREGYVERFAKVHAPSEDIRRARTLIDAHFGVFN